MYYYIDGYNLLFSLPHSKQQLRVLRERLIRFLERQFALCKMKGMVVFDGAHRRDEESGLSYASVLEIAYAPRGQSADAYLVAELAKRSARRRSVAVVTNDKALSAHARELGAVPLSTAAFLQLLQGKARKRRTVKVEVVETKKEMQRLLKAFEERLLQGECEDS